MVKPSALLVLPVHLAFIACTASLTQNEDSVVNCRDSSECPDGTICADAGLCVGEDTACVEAGVSVTNGNRCPLEDGGFGVCIDGACFASRCGDAIVDDRLDEQCDCGDQDREPLERCDRDEIVLNADQPDQCRTNCSLPRCGDGIVDLGELCDDGNLVSGDGCSGDCLSVETCGNGYLDATRGEVCDDGNARSTDGCTGECRVVEVPNWNLESNLLDRGREVLAMAYDSEREVIVIFGGTDGALFGDTLELSADSDGMNTEWRLTTIATEVAPPPRRLAVMAYDRSRRRMVLFGGRESFDAALRNDTWEYDGQTWVRTSDGTQNAPSVRSTPAFGYDREAQRIVLFGGDVGGVDYLDDTWVYDSTGWRQLDLDTAPPARTMGTLAWEGDPAAGSMNDGRLILHGGLTRIDNRSESFNDTWSFSAGSWEDLQPDAAGPTPPNRNRHALATNAAGDGVVVFGGAANNAVSNDTWNFDGSTWTELSSVSVPDPRFFFGLARFDSVGRVVLFGGTNNSGDFFDDFWAHDGTQWSQIELEPFDPDGRRGHGLTYDTRRKRVVLAGGDLGGILNDTWEYDGTAWREGPAIGQPTDGVDAPAIAYHEARGVVVLFSGRGGGGVQETTWEYDGSQWSPSTEGPPPRFQHAMVYDRTRQRIVMFGGCAEFARGTPCEENKIFSDTWSYDIEWQELEPERAPPPRLGHAMAYDELRDRIVMFGGTSSTETNNETWEFDGSTWTLVETTGERPAPRWAHAAAYNPVSNRTFVFGGFDEVSGDFSDTWTYNDDGWSEVFPAFVPTARRNFGMVYDRERRGVFIYGGQPRDPGTSYLFRLTSNEPKEICNTGVDEDIDGLTDCDDPDCNFSASCPTTEQCTNGADDDGDEAIDCDDPNCGGSPCNGGQCVAGQCRPL